MLLKGNLSLLALLSLLAFPAYATAQEQATQQKVEKETSDSKPERRTHHAKAGKRKLKESRQQQTQSKGATHLEVDPD